MSKKIDTDFAEAIAKVNVKLQEAADALNAAVKIANDAGLDTFVEYYGKYNEETDDYDLKLNKGPLMNAIDNAGWSSSSMSC